MVDAIRKRFLIGLLFAWVPWIPIIIGLRQAFRGISDTKATGIAAVAGGLGGAFALWGIIGMVVAQVAAIIWLGKSFAPEHALRNLVSVLSIVVSGLMLVLVCLFVASIWFSTHH
jgi:hypothetical protein